MLSFWETALFSPRLHRLICVAVNLDLQVSPHPPDSSINSLKNLEEPALPLPLHHKVLPEGPASRAAPSSAAFSPIYQPDHPCRLH